MIQLLKNGIGIFCFFILFLALIFVNLAQTISLVILPFSRVKFREFNRYCALFWWGACVHLGQKLHKTRTIVTGDVVPDRENAILVVNHQQMTDIFVLMLFAMSKKSLGDMKWFVKDVLKYVPGIGWGMLFLDCIFVKRSWEADKGKIRSIFSKFLEDRIPIWLISFVEGTRFTAAKATRGQAYAREKGMPVLDHVLLPRTKGFVASLEGLKGHIDAVYDITIGYPGGVPTLWQVIQGKATQFHLHIRRFDAKSPCFEGAQASDWLIHCFQEKDGLMKKFLREKEFAPNERKAFGLGIENNYIENSPGTAEY